MRGGEKLGNGSLEIRIAVKLFQLYFQKSEEKADDELKGVQRKLNTRESILDLVTSKQTVEQITKKEIQGKASLLPFRDGLTLLPWKHDFMLCIVLGRILYLFKERTIYLQLIEFVELVKRML